LMLMAYGIGLVLGEVMREMIFWGSKTYRLYSGLFVLLRLKVKVGYEDMREIVEGSPSAVAPTCLNSCLGVLTAGD